MSYDNPRRQQNFQPQWRGRGKEQRKFGNKKFDKSPTKKKPRVASKSKDQDKDRCHNCREIGHFAKDCPHKEAERRNSFQEKKQMKPYGDFTGMEDYYGEKQPQPFGYVDVYQQAGDQCAVIQDILYEDNALQEDLN